MSGIEFTTNEGGYRTRAHRFVMADDLYTFFKFESPKSDCEIAIAYDLLVSGGDWYVNDGTLDGQDDAIVDDVVFTRLPESPEFKEFEEAVNAARRKFNGC